MWDGRTARRPKGFTLIEMVVVLAVIAAIATVTLNGMAKAKGPRIYSNSTAELVAALRRTRAEALARGVSTAFLVDTATGRFFGFEAKNGLDLNVFDPSTLTPGNPLAPPIFVRGQLASGVTFGPAAGYGAAPPAPFNGLPISGLGYNYCSFCSTGANAGYGAIVFQPGGQALFSAGPTGQGQQFTVTGTITQGSRKLLVGIVSRTGMVVTFER
jgi:prepilin-type N-terminal cleavage/methylation domain-containing protein